MEEYCVDVLMFCSQAVCWQLRIPVQHHLGFSSCCDPMWLKWFPNFANVHRMQLPGLVALHMTDLQIKIYADSIKQNFRFLFLNLHNHYGSLNLNLHQFQTYSLLCTAVSPLCDPGYTHALPLWAVPTEGKDRALQKEPAETWNHPN